MKKRAFVAFVLCMALFAPAAFAQQTGSISGRVTMSDGSPVPGVTVEASADVLPTPRVTVTDENGDYRMPAMVPGTYTLRFTLQGMQEVTRQVLVQLGQETSVGAEMSVQALTESVTVTAQTSYIDRSSAAIKSGVSNQQIQSLPVGQEYRDLVKLIPGVMFTADQTRGPSAGGSGQDNVYQFDGVNVTMPLFGTLSAEPATHDIAQVSTVKGGARAIDFDRSGGLTMDSVSKSGTNRFTGMVSFQLQNNAMAADVDDEDAVGRYEQDRTWTTVNVGGPIIQNRVFFYGSYYRPTRTRENRANVYGDLPEYESVRNEGFGKLTISPTASTLLNVSYRHSDRSDKSDLFGDFTAPTHGTGDDSKQRIATAEGSWVINPRSHATFKYTYFALETLGDPDFVSPATATSALGAMLDINSLDTQGSLSVPSPVAGQDAYNAFIAPLIASYGYLDPATGAMKGGGLAGYASQFNDQDFFRNSGQIAYNLTLGDTITHDLHIGYQQYVDSEELRRSSNGWGAISVPGGRLAAIPGTGQSAFYTARFQRITPGIEPVLNSEFHSKNIEFNDTIRWNNWTFNAGVIASQDTLYGQGLKEDSSTLSGYTLSPGTKYKMYEVPFSKMIQPRLGATWAYNGSDTIFASYARYNPAASSLPRAASWDRNLLGLFVDAHFDANGVLFATQDVGSSSGKLFVEDLTPRTADEFLVGTARQINDRWSVRVYGRYRENSHFWEDTNNNARLAFNAPADIEAKGLYIPNLDDQRRQIGNGSLSGSSYVIAELDGAYTKYRELTVESEWRGARTFLRGSYTLSKYWGNMDQDNSTVDNDQNIFIGSSNIADGAGRQMWDFKDGTLRGDRPHVLKLYGYHTLPWNGLIGAFVIGQSGQPWERWSYEPYADLSSSTNETIKYAEPAGSRRSDAHFQVDLKYTQDFAIGSRYRLQFIGDLFNVLNNQTGYSIEPREHSAGFGDPRLFYDPLRFQLAARFMF